MDKDYVTYELIKRLIDKYCYFRDPQGYDKLITALADILEI